jgi:hypothetical protein
MLYGPVLSPFSQYTHSAAQDAGPARACRRVAHRGRDLATRMPALAHCRKKHTATQGARGAGKLVGGGGAASGPVVKARLHEAFYVVGAGKLVCVVGQPAAF